MIAINFRRQLDIDTPPPPAPTPHCHEEKLLVPSVNWNSVFDGGGCVPPEFELLLPQRSPGELVIRHGEKIAISSPVAADAWQRGALIIWIALEGKKGYWFWHPINQEVPDEFAFAIAVAFATALQAMARLVSDPADLARRVMRTAREKASTQHQASSNPFTRWVLVSLAPCPLMDGYCVRWAAAEISSEEIVNAFFEDFPDFDPSKKRSLQMRLSAAIKQCFPPHRWSVHPKTKMSFARNLNGWQGLNIRDSRMRQEDFRRISRNRDFLDGEDDARGNYG
jgi:hypothetical protein